MTVNTRRREELAEAIRRSGHVFLPGHEVTREGNFLGAAARSIASRRISVSSAGTSFTQVRIRGAEASHSLILIDGRRLPLSPQFSEAGSDLNSIPLASVERVEILTDGASALPPACWSAC